MPFMNNRQTQIITCAIPLFLTEGVGVSTARIAKAAGVSNGTLFNAFATKQDLIDAIYLKTKTDMVAAFATSDDASKDAPLGRARLRAMWDAYLDWAKTTPQDHKVMHLLKDSGLTSPAMNGVVDRMLAPYATGLQRALTTGAIIGPDAAYVGAVIFAQIDLVIDHDLQGHDVDLAFDMLCNTIGLKK
jgi:AcrR family transcriptional regulator